MFPPTDLTAESQLPAATAGATDSESPDADMPHFALLCGDAAQSTDFSGLATEVDDDGPRPHTLDQLATATGATLIPTTESGHGQMATLTQVML